MRAKRRETLNEEDLTAEQKQALEQLRADYRRVTYEIRGYHAGLPTLIAIALVQAGWRKQAG